MNTIAKLNNAAGVNITNVADPVDPQDAAT